MSILKEKWWSKQITREVLFEPSTTKNLTKAELMKIRYILEIENASASSHKILIVQHILDCQDIENPFIVYHSEEQGYVFNKYVDFWSYIKKSKKYR